MFHSPTTLHADGNGELREAMEVVGGAVERIDDPHEFAVDFAAVRAAFLGEEGVVRITLAHGIDDFHLGLGIDLRDEIVLPLLADVEAMDAVHATDDDFTGATGGTDGNIEQRLHVTTTSKKRLPDYDRGGAGMVKSVGGVPKKEPGA